jgi:hypothetical protein
MDDADQEKSMEETRGDGEVVVGGDESVRVMEGSGGRVQAQVAQGDEFCRENLKNFRNGAWIDVSIWDERNPGP